jgi:hypothetical protein
MQKHPEPGKLKSLFDYNPQTGDIHWRQTRRGRTRDDGLVQSLSSQGYLRAKVGGVQIQAHRIAWAIAYGAWPAGVIDHINGNKVDNRLANPRDVSVRVNTENQREAQSRNTHSRLLGASWRPASGVWVARIRVAGRERYLGAFASDVDAHAAYVAAKRSLHAGCSI